MYVNDNRLVVFASKYSSSTGKMGCYDIAIYSGNTEVLIYDITDIENAKLASTLKIEGNYNSSRLVGNILYTVTNKPIDNISMKKWQLRIFIFLKIVMVVIMLLLHQLIF